MPALTDKMEARCIRRYHELMAQDARYEDWN